MVSEKINAYSANSGNTKPQWKIYFAAPPLATPKFALKHNG